MTTVLGTSCPLWLILLAAVLGSSDLVSAQHDATSFDRVNLLLTGGARIEGRLLQETPERFVVDLGVEVLTITKEAVVDKLVLTGPENTAPLDTTSAFFRKEEPGHPRRVRDHVKRWGEAVVEVRTPTSLGSGFLINHRGYVVTNAHVISGEHKITITMFRQQDSELEKVSFKEVRIVASNPIWDLALLRIEDERRGDTPSVILGDSDSIQPGQGVFAIGSPLGLERTVSQGIVSRSDRPINGLLYIQTTAQINPGNSGGPLFDLRGQVIGVNNMKLRATGIEGMGFAIPVNLLEIFLKHRDAYAFDPKNPNSGFHYLEPPHPAISQRGETTP